MAAEELRTDFTGDADSLVKEAKRAEKAYDGVQDSAKDLGRTADITDDDLRAMGDALADSIRDSDRAKESLRKMREEIKRLGDDAPRETRKVGDALHDTADDAADAGREVGSEFRQNLGETLASGGGIGDLFADTLGGLVSSMQGGAAAIFAPMAVAGLFAFNTIKKQWEETQAAIVEQANAMWSSSLQQIGEGVGQVAIKLDEALLVQQELDRLWKEAPDEMTKLVDAGKALNINANDLVRARAGDKYALERVAKAMDDVYARQNAGLDVSVEQIQAVEDIEGAWYKAKTAVDQTTARVDAHNASLRNPAAAVDNIRRDWEWMKQNGKLDIAVNVKNAEQLHKLFPYGYSSSGGGTSTYKSAPGAQTAAAGAGGVPAPPAVVTNNWQVTIRDAINPDRTMRALRRAVRDNGDRDGVTAVGT